MINCPITNLNTSEQEKNHVNNVNTNNIQLSQKDNSLFKIVHWNANSINNKKLEFQKYILQEIEPEIVSLNETKVSEFRAKTVLDFQGYNLINKSRHENKNGAGGVALLIKKHINFIQIENEKLKKFEALAIKIFFKNTNFLLISFYNPPQHDLPEDLILDLNKQFPRIIIMGRGVPSLRRKRRMFLHFFYI